MNTVTISVDLAKHVFEIAITNGRGSISERKRLSRLQFERFWTARAGCRVIMEACASAHFWARYLEQRGFKVVLLPARYVRPYRRRNKTDRTDCEALLEADRCAGIHPVAVKSEDQQALLSLHRLRSQWMGTRTARINSMRALSHEFGVTVNGGPKHFMNSLHAVVESCGERLPTRVVRSLHAMWEECRLVENRLSTLDHELSEIADLEPRIRQLMKIPGVGVLTATALSATIGDIHAFRSGRHLACWLGLTPREFSSGSTRRIGRISKQGDPYLRTLLIHGARAALISARRAQAANKPLTRLQTWALDRTTLMHANQAAVALANKMARIIWAVWYYDREFNGDYMRNAA
jgi:transposase